LVQEQFVKYLVATLEVVTSMRKNLMTVHYRRCEMTIEEAKQTLEKHSPDETSELGEAICIAVKLIDAEIARQIPC